MAKISWSEKAKTDYWDNIDYLLEEWTEKEATNFISSVEQLLELVEKKPKTFRKVDYKKNIHTVPITKQINLFYQVKRNNIELLRFWNNYQSPEKLKLK